MQTPADSYFKHLSNARILDAVTETVSDEAAWAIAKGRTGDIAAAEDWIANTGLLPQPLQATSTAAD